MIKGTVKSVPASEAAVSWLFWGFFWSGRFSSSTKLQMWEVINHRRDLLCLIVIEIALKSSGDGG